MLEQRLYLSMSFLPIEIKTTMSVCFTSFVLLIKQIGFYFSLKTKWNIKSRFSTLDFVNKRNWSFATSFQQTEIYVTQKNNIKSYGSKILNITQS